MQANLSSAQMGELTSDSFAQEYPEIRQYYRDLGNMSLEVLFEGDRLRDFWTAVNIKWFGRPLRPEVPTLAIRMWCSKMQGHCSDASSLCMKFNRPGGCPNPSACRYLHTCLCCGSLEHGFHICPEALKLFFETKKFQSNFGLDPIPRASGPATPWRRFC